MPNRTGPPDTAGGGARRTSRPKRSAPRQVPSARGAQILSTAAELFAERGFRATTVRDIAEAAGVLSGSLYHHFDSKESMADELLSHFLEDLVARCRRVEAADLAPRAQLERLVEEAFDALPRHRAAIVVFQQDGGFLSGFDRFRYLATAAAELETIWVGVLRRGAASGELVCEDPELTYRFVRDAVWMTVHWFRLGGVLTTRDLSQTFLRTLLGGLAPR